MQIKGVTHPIPPKYAKRIYENGKTVFICKSYLGKVSPGDKFVIYESYDSKAYTGWADIVSIGKQKTGSIIKKYGKKMFITPDEFKEYSKRKNEMNIIEFENFEKFVKPVKPDRFVSVGGKYIYENEFMIIEKNKG